MEPYSARVEQQAGLEAGQLLAGRYRLGKLIGRGGMAEVYEGEDTRLRRPVAVKLVLPAPASDPALADRFLREAQAAAALSHPHIVAVYDAGEDEGQRFIVMERVEGMSLQRKLDTVGALPLEEALAIALQIADALSYAHQRGIIHCDINPRNVMLRPDGQVKLVDFGIARAGASTATLPTAQFGTVHYLAPEQLEGSPPNVQTDIYALGLVLYALLTGRPPFDDPNPWRAATQRLHILPEPISRRNPSVPADVNKVVMRALSRERAHRYHSATELAADLRQVQMGLARRATVRLFGHPVGTTRLPAKVGRSQAAAHSYRVWQRLGATLRPLLTFLILLSLVVGAGLFLAQPLLERSTASPVAVPAVEGKLITQAAPEIHTAGLRIKDELVPSHEPVGTVLRQHPPAHTPVKPGATVNLTISRGAGP